jgi:hypothetical protein
MTQRFRETCIFPILNKYKKESYLTSSLKVANEKGEQNRNELLSLLVALAAAND